MKKNNPLKNFPLTPTGLALFCVIAQCSMAATISYVGTERGTDPYLVQNWSNPGVTKTNDLGGSEVFGTSGYYQIRPMPWDPGAANIGEGVGAGNNLGITAGSNPTLYSAPVFLSSITGGAGTYVNYGGYPIFRGPDGSALYRQGSLSVSVANGPYNTPSGANSGYFGEAFTFTAGIAATFRVGVTVDTAGSGSYAPDYVGVYNSGTGTVFSSLLTRDGTVDMAVFEIDAAAGDTFSAAVWQLAGTHSIAPFGLITFDVSRYNFNVGSGQSQTNSAALGGRPAGLLKTGEGTVVLTGASTFQGATTISNGVVELGGAGRLAGGNYTNTVSLAASSSVLRLATSTNQTLSGAISGSGSLVVSGAGTNTLSGSSSYSGGTTISGGRLIASSASALGDAAGAVTVTNVAVLEVSANMTRTGTVTVDGASLISGNSSVIVNNGSGFVLNNAATVAMVLGGTGGMTIGGAGTTVLWSQATNTGSAVINSGTLSLNGAGGISSNSAVQVASGAALLLTGTFAPNNVDRTIAGLTGAGVVYGSGGTLTVNKTSGLDTFTGDIQSGTGLIKTGAGTLALGGATTFTGATTINAGVLVVAHGNALGSTAAGTTVADGAALRLQPAGNITVGAEALTISGQGISAGGALRNATNNNTYQGKVTLAAAARIAAASNTRLTLDVAAGNAIEAVNFDLTFDGAGTNQVNDPIALGTGGLTKVGSGRTILGAANTYTGNTTISLGTVALSGSGSIANSPVITVAGGATLDVSGLSSTFNLGGSQTLSNSSAGAVVNGNLNTGSGTLALVYGGSAAISVSGGTLTLAAGTTVAVNNTGLSLGHGSHKLIAKTGDGLVAGTVPTSCSVTGGGAASPNYLWLSGGELYLAVNNAPVAMDISMGAQVGVLQTLPVIGATKHAPTDADGDTLTISAVTQGANGGVVGISGGNLTYSNSVTGSDSFTYTVSDAFGGSDTKTVTVNVTSVTNQQTPTITFTGGNYNVQFWGVPGTNYTVQFSPGVNGPWSDLLPAVTASEIQPFGRISFTDTNAPGSGTGFYRLKP